MRLIGLVGAISSGKDTAADFLVNSYGYSRDSFASTLKDAVSAIFLWDRDMLEGRTTEARIWRETVDSWWANRLSIPHLTPRWILQNWGTNVIRVGFHDDIWIASLENKIRTTTSNIVISDVRFPNEIQAIHNAGGIIIHVKRGDQPLWFQAALIYNRGPENNPSWEASKKQLEECNIHASETAWIGGNIDYVVTNDSSLESLYTQLTDIVKNV